MTRLMRSLWWGLTHPFGGPGRPSAERKHEHTYVYRAAMPCWTVVTCADEDCDYYDLA